MNQSRRAVLAACGAGLTTLAGCSGLDSGRATPSYDTSELVALGEQDVPPHPETFPVSVPDALLSRHRDRARVLVERVPEQPDIPNEAVAERLRGERRAVLERIGDEVDESNDRAVDSLVRLGAARGVRGDAAAVEATYRAATNAISPATVADQRGELWRARLEFERDWAYRSDDPVSAVVVHRAFEELRLEARPGIAPERRFPADPPADPVRAGELVRHIEVGSAALADAEDLRARYREGLADPQPYRTAISVAAERVHQTSREYRRDLDAFIDTDPAALPIDRSIEGTPLEQLYYRATGGVEVFRTDAEAARYRGDHATALVEAGIYLTVLRGLDAIVEDLRDDRVNVPETAGELAAARQSAIARLEHAWSTAPTAIAVGVAHWSWRLVLEARDLLRETGDGMGPPDTRDGYAAWAMYLTATQVAAAVPPTIEDIQAALRAATR